jgi:hypothetical protein
MRGTAGCFDSEVAGCKATRSEASYENSIPIHEMVWFTPDSVVVLAAFAGAGWGGDGALRQHLWDVDHQW